MKNLKFLIPIFISIFCGLAFGALFFNKYETLTVNNEEYLAYFVEKNMYKNEDEAKNNSLKENLLLIEEDGIHEYVSITKNLETAKKIKELYNSLGNNTYIREKVLKNKTFINELTDYDKLLTSFKGEQELISVSKSIISSYKENEINDTN